MSDDRPALTPAVMIVLCGLGYGLSAGILFPQPSAPFPGPFLWSVLIGIIVVRFFGRPFRAQGFTLLAGTAWFTAAAVGWATGGWSGWVLGGTIGVTVAAVVRYPQRALTGWDLWWLYGGCLVGLVLTPFAGLVPGVRGADWLPAALVAVTGLLAAIAWYVHFRPFFELACEPVLWLMYSVRRTGPGLADIPPRGPCLVIGNHACWADPFFIAKVLPRPITPVMTSQFYDKPVISWLMRRVIKAIRVPEKALKQDVPQEIREVIAALDRGECVVLFPEGYLRRSDERFLRRFGRGVWQVLSARPDTPVFPCWIEGGWGSYTSYKGGLPTKNKRPDFRRRIGVAVDVRVSLPPETLTHHLGTRIELMNRVAAARKLLGLPELPPYTLAGREEYKDGAADDADRSADERGSNES